MKHIFATIWFSGLVCLAGLSQAQDSLTQDQRLQLDTATDQTRLDQGALYGLLSAAVGWQPFDDRGARVPDYDAIRADPSAARGEPFLIEGAFVAEGEVLLAREGDWGRSLSYWVIKYGDVDSNRGDDVVVVLMVSPDGKPGKPAVRQPVRVPAVFYKVWRDPEKTTGEPTDFLTFVARAGDLKAALAGPPPKRNDGTASGEGSTGSQPLVPTSLPLVIVIVVALLVAWFMLRRVLQSIRVQPNLPHRARGKAEDLAADENEAARTREDLPENPADAMAVLKTQHDQAVAREKAKPRKDPVDALGELEQEHDQADAEAEPRKPSA